MATSVIYSTPSSAAVYLSISFQTLNLFTDIYVMPKKHNFMLDLTFRQRRIRGIRPSWLYRCVFRCFPTFRKKSDALNRATRSSESQELHTRISEYKFYIIITKQWIFVGSDTLKKVTMTFINFREVTPCSLLYIWSDVSEKLAISIVRLEKSSALLLKPASSSETSVHMHKSTYNRLT